jgi:hypothetical protein
VGGFLEGGGPQYASPYYVSPDGTALGLGTEGDPMDLDTAMTIAQNGETIICMDGIYTDDSVVLGKTGVSLTIQADTGARPVFVHSDGQPPEVDRKSNTTVTDLWFGGTKPGAVLGSKAVQNGSGGGFTDCTFWGYIQGIINGSDAHGNIYRRNRFVNCGYQNLHHPLYIANMNSSLPEHGVLSEENIMVGSEGYSVHYYHEPAYGLAQYNFMGDCRDGLALQGDESGPVSGNRNIIWGATGSTLYNICASGNCDHNVFHGCPQPSTPGGTINETRTFDNNYFHGVVTNGSNPITWQDADVSANFGKTPAQIDAAISALETAFAGTVQQIHDSATIEPHFATLKAVIDTWKLQ